MNKPGWFAAGLLVLAWCSACAVPPPSTSATPTSSVDGAAASAEATIDRTLTDARIRESSGLAVSGRDPDILITHNDSDDGPYLYRVAADGGPAGRIEFVDAPARDWEAMARIGEGARSRLFVGDIGDNIGGWPDIRVIVADEPPGTSDVEIESTTYRFAFEDGPRDAEALLVSPVDGRVAVVSKRIGSAAIYRAPATLSAERVNVLTRWRSAPSLITDGAYSPDGQRYALRGYTRAYVFDAETGERLATLPLPLQPQGESLAWTDDGSALLVGSEGVDQPVYRVPVPG
jgi:hypothetical protein